MTAENFIYWLQGFFEITKPESINEQQLIEIKNHIKLTLEKISFNQSPDGKIGISC